MVANKGTSYFREPIPLWLIEHLNDQFPDKIPTNQVFTLEDLRVYQGKRIVISYIENLTNNNLEEY
jgi:hypothetical protein